MPVGAPEGLVLAIDVVAHQEGAEVVVQVVELELFHIFGLIGEELSEYLVVDWSHVYHLGYP